MSRSTSSFLTLPSIVLAGIAFAFILDAVGGCSAEDKVPNPNGVVGLCYGPPPPLIGRICESPRAIINFARVNYRVSYVKNAHTLAIINLNESAVTQIKSQSKGTVCCDGRGMMKNQEFWVPLGCSKEVEGEAFSRTIYFDGVIGFPAIRCSGIPEGVFVQWSH